MRQGCGADAGYVDARAESLVVLAAIGVVNSRMRARLYRSLREIDPRRIDLATARLINAGVLDERGARVVQSTALARLDRLDMICL